MAVKEPKDEEIQQAAAMCLRAAGKQAPAPFVDSMIVVRNWSSKARARLQEAIVHLQSAPKAKRRRSKGAR